MLAHACACVCVMTYFDLIARMREAQAYEAGVREPLTGRRRAHAPAEVRVRMHGEVELVHVVIVGAPVRIDPVLIRKDGVKVLATREVQGGLRERTRHFLNSVTVCNALRSCWVILTATSKHALMRPAAAIPVRRAVIPVRASPSSEKKPFGEIRLRRIPSGPNKYLGRRSTLGDRRIEQAPVRSWTLSDQSPRSGVFLIYFNVLSV